MNCQEFRSDMDGLARSALLDARARDEASAHEEECAACAARLADERALTAGLRALAATMREAETPARAEVALLSAFRSRHAASLKGEASAPAATSNVVSLPGREGLKEWSWVRTVAAAALAAAAAVALFMLTPPFMSTHAPTRPEKAAASQSQGITTRMPDAPGADSGGAETAGFNVAQDSSSSGGGGARGSQSKDEEVAPRAPAPRRAAPAARAIEADYGGAAGRVAASDRGAASETADLREITTEFIPLVQDGGFAQSEGGRLVRVELPRAALSSFGIPLNGEHAGGRVKADVLLGEDGTARAIRFVR